MNTRGQYGNRRARIGAGITQSVPEALDDVRTTQTWHTAFFALLFGINFLDSLTEKARFGRLMGIKKAK